MYNLTKEKFIDIKKNILKNKIGKVFDKIRLIFLDELSDLIIKNKSCKNYGDLIALSFWLKKKNLLRFKSNYLEKNLILPKGIVFHITPNNVPTNFIYSFVFSFLAGNKNLVKLPSENFEQVKLIIESINFLKKKIKYKKIFKENFFFNYDKDDFELSKNLSEISDVRIIWGADKTIEAIKKIKTKTKSKDIIFNNRYSVCVINSKVFNNLNDIAKNKVIFGFYNDVYGFDQNACTSPHLIFWIGDKKNNIIAKKNFWSKLSFHVEKKYSLDIGFVAKRLSFLQQELIKNTNKSINELINYNDLVYVFRLNKIYKDIYKNFKKFGIFFEYEAKNFNKLSILDCDKYQTLTYYGFDKDFLREKSLSNRINFFDRIVPIGKSMEMEYCWDGYNLFSELTRKVHLI